MTAEAKKDGASDGFESNPLVFVDDAFQFNQDLLNRRIQHFQQSLTVDTSPIFFDRGIPDVLAYMHFFDQPYPNEFVEACKVHKYDTIFITPPWKEIYVSDNERLETYEEAEEIHNALFQTYTRFGYAPIIVPKKPIDERVNHVLETLNPV